MSIYNLLNNTSAMALVIYNLLHIKERSHLKGGRLRNSAANRNAAGVNNILTNEKFWLIIETFLVSCFQYLPTSIFNASFGKSVGTGANYFGFLYFGPLVLYFFCIFMKMDPLEQMDLVTPALPLALVFVKCACFAAGCCRGFEWEYGFYNSASGLREFPVQLVEGGVALIIFIFLLKTKDRMKKGTVFPIYFMIHSGIRFFTEFLRVEEAILFGLKRYHYLCLIGLLLGAVEYYIVIKLQDKNQ